MNRKFIHTVLLKIGELAVKGAILSLTTLAISGIIYCTYAIIFLGMRV